MLTFSLLPCCFGTCYFGTCCFGKSSSWGLLGLACGSVWLQAILVAWPDSLAFWWSGFEQPQLCSVHVDMIPLTIKSRPFGITSYLLLHCRLVLIHKKWHSFLLISMFHTIINMWYFIKKMNVLQLTSLFKGIKITGCPAVREKSGKFHTRQKSGNCQGILLWVREN